MEKLKKTIGTCDWISTRQKSKLVEWGNQDELDIQ